jgi:hypothetical protein
MQVVSVKQTTFVMDELKLIILVQGHECLYNLQHNDYDNNLVKDNCWNALSKKCLRIHKTRQNTKRSHKKRTKHL